MIKIDINIRNSETFNNIWLFLSLLIGCIVVVAWVIGSYQNPQKIQIDNNIVPKNVGYFNNYFEAPLPLGANQNLIDGANYQIDNAFVTKYLIAFVNQSNYRINNGDDFYLYDIDRLNKAADKYFGYSTMESNFVREETNYLVPAQSNSSNYELRTVNKKKGAIFLTYYEIKTAYFNGDVNSDSKAVSTGKYIFKIITNGDAYLVSSYRFEKIDMPADDYIIVVE